MLALACGLKPLPWTTMVVGQVSPRGVMMVSGGMAHYDLNCMLERGKKLAVLPLASLKYLLSKAASAEHSYVVLEEGESEIRALYGDTLKVRWPCTSS